MPLFFNTNIDIFFFYCNKSTRKNRPTNASGSAGPQASGVRNTPPPPGTVVRRVTPTPEFATRIFPPSSWGMVLNRTTTQGDRVSTKPQQDMHQGLDNQIGSRVFFRNSLLKQGVTIHIDLTERDSTTGLGIGAGLRGATARGAATRGVAVVSSLATQRKGKRVVTIIEKGIEIMEAKRRMMKSGWKH